MPERAAVRAFQRAIDAQRAAEADLLARLEFAFRWHVRDVAQGVGRIEELAGETIEAASELVAAEIPAAVQRAKREIVDPVLEWGGDRAKLRPGWERELGTRVDFYATEVGEQLDRARDAFLTEIGRLLREADAFGWADETVERILLDEVKQRGRTFATFRAAVRDAVASVAGQAWTETWTAAWAALDVTPPAEGRE